MRPAVHAKAAVVKAPPSTSAPLKEVRMLGEIVAVRVGGHVSS